MNVFELFTTAFSALKSNLMRTLLTVLGIVIGIASVILIVALARGATASITSQVSSLGSNVVYIFPGRQERGPVQSSGSVDTLTYDDALALADKKNISNISAVSPLIRRQYQIVGNGENMNTAVQGVTADYAEIQTITMQYGSFISPEDMIGYSNVAVIGTEVMKTLFGEGASPVGQIIRINNSPFRVIGVPTSEDASGFTNPDEAIYIPITTGMKTIFGQNFVSFIQVFIEDASKTNETMSHIEAFLMGRHKINTEEDIDFTIRSSQEALSTVSNITNLLTLMLAGIAAISLVVGGIGIMNIMLVTVTERTREIGLLKAIGAKKKDILTQFLIESITITVIGGIIGVVLGELLALIGSKLLKVPFIFQLSPVLLAVSVAIIIGLVFGIYPARRAANLNPIEALRYE